jgi:hypothetical protein
MSIELELKSGGTKGMSTQGFLATALVLGKGCLPIMVHGNHRIT